MKYEINSNGQIRLENEKYWILSGELNNFNREELSNILTDIENVLNGKYENSSFSKNVIVVGFDKDIAQIEDFDGVIGEESTEDIYKMLKEWLFILQDRESRQSQQ
ncbi:MAG: hypothetical protein NVV82_22435 [Sporocytophaga sp.]|nr:hypothetical protein [Sporocytophaga sp.]